ncbi:MAG: hypothetical protein ACLVL7_09865 [Anaerotruncus massiliensis (ex Togo et al. 2019)]
MTFYGAVGASPGAPFSSWADALRDARTHRRFRCPSCGQKVRVPRGKGRICITCPRCRVEFVRRT